MSIKKKFDELEICDEMKRNIKAMGFETMTEIQEKSVPYLLDGKDVVGSAKTGSGKTMAFAIPTIELLHKLNFKNSDGTGALIISPTRELSIQTFGVIKELLNNHNISCGLTIGGSSRNAEAKKLAGGINIVVATPGRLLDHLRNTPNFFFRNLQCLVIDEADRILDIGFEEDLKQIIKILPKKRQTLLFTATLSKKTEDLTAIALKKEPLYISVDEKKESATVAGLQQAYAVVPTEKKFLLLYTFLKKRSSEKIMVFFSSCMSVEFHYKLLQNLDLPVLRIHGKKKQSERTSTFFSFCGAKSGILLCTDVAARGLDIPEVDCILQYDPPDDPKEYIHRVGRTARGVNGKGEGIIFLRHEEIAFVQYLKNAKVSLYEAVFAWKKVPDIQLELERLVQKNYDLNKSAKEAYKCCVRAYMSHHLKNIFNVETLDFKKLAAAFALTTPPGMDLIYHTDKPEGRKRGGSGYGYFKEMNQQPKRQKKSKMYIPK